MLPQTIFNLQNKDFHLRAEAMEGVESCCLSSEYDVSVTQDGDSLGNGHTIRMCLTVLYCTLGEMNFICGFIYLFLPVLKLKNYLLNTLCKSLESYPVTQNMSLNSNPHPMILIQITLQKIIILPNTYNAIFKRKSGK